MEACTWVSSGTVSYKSISPSESSVDNSAIAALLSGPQKSSGKFGRGRLNHMIIISLIIAVAVIAGLTLYRRKR